MYSRNLGSTLNINPESRFHIIKRNRVVIAGKDCGFPGRPDNGSTQSAEKFFYPGEEVTFECDGGFILFGKARRTCLDDGTWTDTLPECSELHSI